jgi:hypothetical protein
MSTCSTVYRGTGSPPPSRTFIASDGSMNCRRRRPPGAELYGSRTHMVKVDYGTEMDWAFLDVAGA